MDLKTLIEIANQDNIADQIDDLPILGQDVVRFAKLDDETRADWLKKSKAGMDLALQIAKTKNVPWENSSNVMLPIIGVAALQFHARAYPAIINGNHVVKGKVTGFDPDNMKLEKSRRISMHMNWQLLEQNEDWEEDTDKLLLSIAIEGCEFKKSQYNSDFGYNTSEWVRPEDFIVNNKTRSLKTCPRMTHRMWYYPYEIDNNVREEIWIKAELGLTIDEYKEERLQEFYEQHLYMDLDNDGMKEPYIVTVHVASEQVVRVVAGYLTDDIVVNVKGVIGSIGSMRQGTNEETFARGIEMAEIVRIPRLNMFTKFGFVPSPDGTFYDIGFGQLIGHLSESVNTLTNQLIDSGTLANRQGGFIAEGVSIDNKRGKVKFEMGEFKSIQLPANRTMNDAIYQLRFPEPSTVLFQLLGMLVQASKDITSVQDIMTGAPINPEQAATTSLIQIEQGMKVFASIYQRIHRSLKQEFKKLYKLNRSYLPVEEYFNILDTGDPAKVSNTDYADDGSDVQPVSDPQMVTAALAVVKSQALLAVMQHPLLQDEEILRRHFQALDIPDIDKIFVPADQRQAPPDPELVLKAQIAASEAAKRKAEIVKLYAQAFKDVALAESAEQGAQAREYLQTIKEMMLEFKNADQQGAVSGMAESGSNQGMVQQPQQTEG